MPYYYHYTSKAGRDGIKSSGTITQSVKMDDADDARLGNGVYLTSVTPDEGKRKIITVCWSAKAVQAGLTSGRVNYFFRIKYPKSLTDTNKPRVFLHKGDLKLANYEWDDGEVLKE